MIKNEELLARIKKDIAVANSYYETEIHPLVDELKKLAEGDEDYYTENFPGVNGKFVSRDIANTVEYIMPDLMKLFNGSKQPVVIVGRTADDMQKAEVMQSLCNYQMAERNKAYLLNYNWFKEALYYGLGVVKARWDRVKRTDKHTTYLYDDQYAKLVASGADIVKAEPVGTVDPITGYSLHKVTYKHEVIERNEPVFENLKLSEFRYDPDARTIKDAAYCIHIKDVTVDYLKRNERQGLYSNIDEAIDAYKHDDYNELNTTHHDAGYNSGARRKVKLLEYWGKIDMDDSGELNDVVVTLVGDSIISIQENTFKSYPFFTLTAILEPHQVMGRSIGELVKQVQNLKTVLVREMIENATRNNDRRVFLNTKNLDDANQLITGDKFIGINGNPNEIINYEPFEPLAPNTSELLQYAEREREINTGISEIKQGIIPSKMATTATFATLLYEAANARVQIIARIFAETGIRDLYAWLVDANQKFIDQQQVVRLTNKYLYIDTSSLQNIQFDLDVSAGLGTGANETKRQGLEALLQLSTSTLMQLGLSNADKVRNIVAEIITEIGFKDVGNYIITKEEQAHMLMKQGAKH